MRQPVKRASTLKGERNVRGPKSVHTRIEAGRHPGVGQRSKPGRGFSPTGSESEDNRGLADDVAQARGTRLSRAWAAGADHAIDGDATHGGTGAQDRPADHGERFFKKNVR